MLIYEIYFEVKLAVLKMMPCRRRPIHVYGDETQVDLFQTLALGGGWFEPRSGHVTSRAEAL
jgi:hypothetical protein